MTEERPMDDDDELRVASARLHGGDAQGAVAMALVDIGYSLRRISRYLQSNALMVTLPDPHQTSNGTTLTVGTQRWECVHEGNHAFWEPKDVS